MTMTTTLVLFEFPLLESVQNWKIVDDVVMGGESNGSFYLNKKNNAVFTGKVSLENNGGFSSVRTTIDNQKINQYKTISLKVRGDGKRFQLRLKSNISDYFSYASYFNTTGEWEIITLPLHEMWPTYRGNKLDMPNYPGELLNEIAILIGNNKSESFTLEIESIYLDQ